MALDPKVNIQYLYVVAGVAAIVCLEPVRQWEAGQRRGEHRYYVNQNELGCCMNSAPAFIWGTSPDFHLPSVLSPAATNLHFPTEPHCLALQLHDVFSILLVEHLLGRQGSSLGTGLLIFFVICFRWDVLMGINGAH
jgi:hypothetical protein